MLASTQVKLCSYKDECISVVGSFDVDVVYKSQNVHLSLVVVKGSGPTLIGRNWLEVLQLDWKEIFNLSSNSSVSLDSVIQKHETVFQDGLGMLEGFEAKILVDPSAKPKYCKIQAVPYAPCDKVEKELTRLVNEGTLLQ